MTALRPITRDLPRPEHVEPGPAPMLQWIDIDKLVVDERYQRGLQENNWKAVKRIAERFDWSKFLAVHVAPIEGGLFAIIDGQHRTHAAAACGFSQVPCLATHMSLTQQASAFAAINGLVTAVTPVQIYKAALAAGEHWAVNLRDACEAAGCSLPTYQLAARRKAGQVICIQFSRKLVEARSLAAFQAALTILRRADGIGDNLDCYNLQLFRPLMNALAERKRLHERIDDAAAALAQLPLDDKAEEASRFVAERRRAGLPVMTRMELLESLIGDFLDKALPATALLTAPRAA